MSARAISALWPGSPYIRSMFTLSNAASAASTARLARVVDAAERLQHALVEALHPDRDAVHPGSAKATETAGFHRAGIRFQRDLRRGLERQPRAHAGQQRGDRVGREQAPRTAAEEYAGEAPAPHRRQMALQVEQQSLEIGLLGQLAGALVRIEVAVRTLPHAPGDVNVERERRQRGQAHFAGTLNVDGIHAAILGAFAG